MSHARLVQDWIEGWNTRNLDRLMSHYADDVIFTRPSVLVYEPGSDGTLHGKAAIRKRYRFVFEPFAKLRFEIEEVI